MEDLTQYKVKDLRRFLVQSGKYTKEEVHRIKGKSALKEAVQKLHEDDDEHSWLNELEEEDNTTISLDNEKSQETTKKPKITYGSTEWHDFVMSHFEEDELVEGNPKVDALRRVAELLLGNILFSGAVSVNNQPGFACVNYKINIEWTLEQQGYVAIINGQLESSTPSIKTFCGVGDAHAENTDGIYGKYLSAMAETRAEGRALKKALQLKLVHAAEELSQKALKAEVEQIDDFDDENALITDLQKNWIGAKTDQLGIDIEKFINKKYYLGEKENKDYKNINEVPKNIASKMVKTLNAWQDDSVHEIPKEILKDKE